MRTILTTMTITLALALSAGSARANSILNGSPESGNCAHLGGFVNDGNTISMTLGGMTATTGDDVAAKEKKKKCTIVFSLSCDAEGTATLTTNGSFNVTPDSNASLDISSGKSQSHNTFGAGSSTYSITTMNVKVCPKGKAKPIKLKYLLKLLKVAGQSSEISIDTISFTLN